MIDPRSRRAEIHAPQQPQYVWVEPEEVAGMLLISVRTLYTWRRFKSGPPAVKFGRHLRYRKDLLYKWIAEQEAQETNRVGEERPA